MLLRYSYSSSQVTEGGKGEIKCLSDVHYPIARLSHISVKFANQLSNPNFQTCRTNPNIKFENNRAGRCSATALQSYFYRHRTDRLAYSSCDPGIKVLVNRYYEYINLTIIIVIGIIFRAKL